jgi:hypothetical protein
MNVSSGRRTAVPHAWGAPPRRDTGVQRHSTLPSGKGPRPPKVVFAGARSCQHR